MLDVHHEEECLVVAWDGTLDESAVDRILAALASIDGAGKIVLDLTRAGSIRDSAIARLSQSRPVEFRGLRAHQERLLSYLQAQHPMETTVDTSPLDEWANVDEETTESFCRLFVGEADYCGAFARSVSRGALPTGVDPHDPRVLEIQRKCREREDCELPFTD